VTYSADCSKKPRSTDLLIRSKAGGEDGKQKIVLLMEVGINTDWWRKVHQNVKYVNHFLEEAGAKEDTVFRSPFLFAVLTISTKNKYDDPAFVAAQLGVFLCTRAKRPSVSKGEESFRMSLLWRQESDNLLETSKAIGKTLRAACLLPDLLDEVDRQGYEFEYLGPSYCRRGNRVRIFADRDGPVCPGWSCVSRHIITFLLNRCIEHTTLASGTRPAVPTCMPSLLLPRETAAPSPTFRSCAASAILKTILPVEAGEIGIAMLDDRRRVDRVRDKMGWMWLFHGELLVIKILYIKGAHFATLPTDFEKVITFLQKMHDEG
jgi:hypothetical protein